MSTFRVLATRDGLAYACNVLDQVSARCGACGRGRILHGDKQCRACGATITWEDIRSRRWEPPEPSGRIILPPPRSQHAEALAAALIQATETAQREISDLRADRRTREAHIREREWKDQVVLLCHGALAAQADAIDKLTELLCQKDMAALWPRMLFYPQPQPGVSYTVTHEPTERCKAAGAHALGECREYAQLKPARIKLPEGPPERWPKIPKEWL